MEKRNLGSGGLEVSALGSGCMGMAHDGDVGEDDFQPGELFWYDRGDRARTRPQLDDGADEYDDWPARRAGSCSTAHPYPAAARSGR